MASSIPGFGLVEASLCFLEADPSHPSQAQQASFLPAQHFGNLLFFRPLAYDGIIFQGAERACVHNAYLHIDSGVNPLLCLP